MPTVGLSDESIQRLDALRVEDETYDDLLNELVNSYEAEELTPFRSGDG